MVFFSVSVCGYSILKGFEAYFYNKVDYSLPLNECRILYFTVNYMKEGKLIEISLGNFVLQKMVAEAVETLAATNFPPEISNSLPSFINSH